MSDASGREQMISHTVVNLLALSANVRAAVATVAGLTVNGSGIVAVVHTTPDTTDDTLAESIVLAHNMLAVSADKASFAADDVAMVTITCNDAAISGDGNVDYEVYQVIGSAKILDEAGTLPVVGGVATLEYTTPLVGVYQFRIARQSGYADGYVESEAI